MEWREIPGYTKYEVSKDGQIRHKDDGTRFAGRLMKQSYNMSRHSKDYPMIWLYGDGGKRKFLYVHRLVATAFIPNPEGKKVVNHINNRPADNRVENLEWVTHSENITHCPRCAARDLAEEYDGCYL